MSPTCAQYATDPRTTTRPSTLGISLMSAESRLLLPHPTGPATPTICPRPRLRERPLSVGALDVEAMAGRSGMESAADGGIEEGAVFGAVFGADHAGAELGAAPSTPSPRPARRFVFWPAAEAPPLPREWRGTGSGHLNEADEISTAGIPKGAGAGERK
jgi:hypothetical protein